jgi:hypothetical protein
MPIRTIVIALFATTLLNLPVADFVLAAQAPQGATVDEEIQQAALEVRRAFVRRVVTENLTDKTAGDAMMQVLQQSMLQAVNAGKRWPHDKVGAAFAPVLVDAIKISEILSLHGLTSPVVVAGAENVPGMSQETLELMVLRHLSAAGIPARPFPDQKTTRPENILAMPIKEAILQLGLTHIRNSDITIAELALSQPLVNPRYAEGVWGHVVIGTTWRRALTVPSALLGSTLEGMLREFGADWRAAQGLAAQ